VNIRVLKPIKQKKKYFKKKVTWTVADKLLAIKAILKGGHDTTLDIEDR
jgi:hypothetical protein